MLNKIKLYISLFAFSFFLLIDIFFLAGIIASVGESIASAVVLLVITVPFVYLTIKIFLYCKRFGKEKPSSNVEQAIPAERIENFPVEKEKTAKKKNDGPDFEIKYIASDGSETVRQIKVIDFKGRMLEAVCFLRHEKRTFAVSRIAECVDLSTGEVIQEELHFYFNRRYNKNYKLSTMFSFEEWTTAEFVNVPEMPKEIDGFSLDEKLNMQILDLDSGVVEKEFVCDKVRSSLYNENQFYMSLRDSDGKVYSVDLGKILKVKGVENFGEYLISKFYESDLGKASVLLSKYFQELFILAYLGRADSSITPKKRATICEFLRSVGADCNDEIISKALRKIKVDQQEFKKIVNAYSKTIANGNKKDFLQACGSVVGGREKAKPFGFAGLQYIESKIIL